MLRNPDTTETKDGTTADTWIIDEEETAIIQEIHEDEHDALSYAIYLAKEYSPDYKTPAQWSAYQVDNSIHVERFTNAAQRVEHTARHITEHSAAFTIHTDPGHAWIEVPRALVQAMQQEPATAFYISSFSYQDAMAYYLEEDCDMYSFMIAHRDMMEETDNKEWFSYYTQVKHVDSSHPIRNKRHTERTNPHLNPYQ